VAAHAAVRVEGLCVTRGASELLHELTFAIPAGRLVGLLGPSGCGKTTLMRSLVGVQKNVSGTVEVLGRPAGRAELRARVAYLTQAPSVYADLTVRENLRYFTSILGSEASDIERVLERVGMSALADHVVRRLSGGEQARVSLASALLGEPELLVSCGSCLPSSLRPARRCLSHRT
jgi:ABC-2 type transport system ATP-binding protein